MTISLLDLPEAVRLTIYAYADVPGIGTPHSCMEDAEDDPFGDFSEFDDPGCVVSRAKDDASLGSLSRLKASSIHALRRLTIQLNATSCGLDWICEDEADPKLDAHIDERILANFETDHEHEAIRPAFGRRCAGKWTDGDRDSGEFDPLSIFDYSRSQPLTISNELHRAVLRNWCQVWANIRAHLAPARLELDFTCDVADIETGELALQPFLIENQTYLARLYIRFARRKVEALQELAQLAIERTVCSFTLNRNTPHIRRCTNSITLMDLPAEIRQHILGYTDLVVPDNEVEWSPYRGWYLRKGAEGFHGFGQHDLRHIHPIAKDESENTNDAHMFRIENYNRAYCREKIGGRGCFCKSRHTACSSYSKVACWAPPTSLFLVNSHLRQDALQIFFSQNRIILWPSNSMWYPKSVLQSPSRLHVSIFLCDVVSKDALRHLRYLEVVFEHFGYPEHLTWCPTNSPELIDWKRRIEEIKPYLSSSRLAIKVVFPPEPLMYYDELPDEHKRIVEFSHVEFLHRKTCYFNTVLPLQSLAGHLKHLWIRIYSNAKEPGGPHEGRAE